MKDILRWRSEAILWQNVRWDIFTMRDWGLKRIWGRRISEQIFGTNVLKIAVCIYTNKMLYGIIRVALIEEYKRKRAASNL